MKEYFFIILTMLCFSATSQNVKTSVDKVSGDTIRFISLNKLYSQSDEILKFALFKDKSGSTICFSVITRKTLLVSVGQTDTAFIKTDAGIIKLAPLGNTSGNYSNSPDQVFYKLDEQALQGLKGSEISFIRITHSGGNLDYNIKDKFKKSIQSAANKIF